MAPFTLHYRHRGTARHSQALAGSQYTARHISVSDACHTGATFHRLSRVLETIPVILGITGSQERGEGPKEEIDRDWRAERRKRLGDARNRAISAVL